MPTVGIEQGTINLIEVWGIPGFFILVLAVVIVYLWRDGKSKDKLINEIQEKRLQDFSIYTAGIEKFRETNEKVVEQLRLTVDHLRGQK
jgi:hypothetical protein